MNARRWAVPVAAALLAMAGQPGLALTVQARTAPQLPQAKGLGPRPTHSVTGDCRDPTPEGQLCIEGSGDGIVTFSPHVVQACKTNGKEVPPNCPKITATFSPTKGAVVWGNPQGFSDCGSFHYTADDDVPGGKRGGPITCTLTATSPTGGWTTASMGIAGPCGSVHAAQQGKTEFAACASATTIDYFAILPPDVGLIDGTVTEKDGTTPIPGIAVQIRSSDNHRSVAYTDSTGYYSAYVDAGDYTVCPCFFRDNTFNQGATDTFTPRSPTLSVHGYVTQNFVQGGWTISGKLTRKVTRKDDPPLAGITIGITGKDGFYREALTDKDGHYSVTVPDGSYVVEGLTPPNVRGNEFIDGVPYQCVHGGVPSATAQCVLQVTSDQNDVDFVLNNEYKLSVTESPSPAIAGRNVHKITTKVLDGNGDPVAGKKVHFSASAPPGAKVIVATLQGQALFASVGPALGAAAAAAQFEFTTDWSGDIDLFKWFGDDSALTLKEAIDDSTGSDQDLSTDPSEETELDDSAGPLPASGPPLPANVADVLDRGIRARLRARPPATWTARELQVVLLDNLNALADTGNADFEPVMTPDGKSAGIVVYPKNTDDRVLQSIAAFLSKPGGTAAVSPAVSGALVIDMDEVLKVLRDPLSQRILPEHLLTLAAWATAHPGAAEGMLSGDDSSGISRGVLYNGWFRPPSLDRRIPFDQTLGVSSQWMRVTTRGPVTLLATAITGQQIGKRAGLLGRGQPVIEVPGSEVLDYARMGVALAPPAPSQSGGEIISYLLPPNIAYELEVTGTGNGPATLEFFAGNGSPIQSYSLRASAGDSGIVAISAGGGVQNPFTFGSQTVNSDDGPKLRLQGVPQSFTAQSEQRLQLRVTDAFGQPVPEAWVDVSAKGFGQRAVAAPDGTVTTTVKPLDSAALTFSANSPGYASATVMHTVNTLPRQGSAAARSLAAAAPNVGPSLLSPTDKNIIVPAAVLVAMAGLGGVVVWRRRGLINAVTP